MQELKRAEDVERAAHMETYIFAYVTVIHEYNAHGAHRLRIQYRAYKRGRSITTEWYRYEDIIVVTDDGTPDYRQTSICATTQYWEGEFPRVFRVEAAERLS